jgi:hypothetical protein
MVYTSLSRIVLVLQRIFPADFGERQIISEGYLNSYSIM